MTWIEGWHPNRGPEESPALLANPAASIPGREEKVREHIKNVFRPAMHWLTLAGIYVVKNSGPIAFLDAVADLLKEVFDTSHQLGMSRTLTPYGAISPCTSIDQHVSHTVPALESLVSLQLIGAYPDKTKSFSVYEKSLSACCVSCWAEISRSRKDNAVGFLASQRGVRGTR